jgi:thiol-disulfide isomerase/thioredoxin
MKKSLSLLVLIALVTFNSFAQDKTFFDKVALEEVFVTQKGEEIQFKNILDKYKGQTIFIDIWASWCSDCVGSIPKLKILQLQNSEVVYIMLSLDKTPELWKKGIEKYNLEGEHYLFTNKWKQSKFCKSIALDWIPRYMIVGKDGIIKMYKAIEVNDEKIMKAFK